MEEDKPTPRPKRKLDLAKLKNLLAALPRAVLRFLTLLLGNVHWTPPAWISRARARIAPLTTRIAGKGNEKLAAAQQWANANPKRLWKIAGGIAGVTVLGLGGYAGYLQWLAKHPPPSKFTVWLEAPPLTKLEAELKPFPLHVKFSGSAARLEQVGQNRPIKSGITMDPPVDGVWYWSTDHEMVFEPKNDWGVGQEYTVRFERELFPPHVRLTDYKLTFKSAPFSAEIVSAEFYQDPKKPKIKKVVATIKFSHAVDTKDFEKRVRMRLEGEKEDRKFTVSYDKLKGEAYLHSDEIGIPRKDTPFTLKIEKGVRAVAGGGGTGDAMERQVNVPGMFTYFRVSSANITLVRNEQYEPEQVLVIETTAEAEEKEIERNLSVYLLPRKPPKLPGEGIYHSDYWSDASKVGPEALKLATPVKLTAIPTELEADKMHTFKFEAPVGRHLYIKINKGTKSYGDYVLADPFDAIRRVPKFPKELTIMHDGALLALSGEKKLSLLARDLDALHFEVGRVIPSEINHLISQTGGTFMKPYWNGSFNADNITEVFQEERRLRKLAPGKTQYTSFDFTNYLAKGDASLKRGLFFFKVESWDPERKVTTGKRDQRLILVTDLGVLVKTAKDGSQSVYVQSIYSGKPVAGATVEVIGKNGIAVLTQTTGPEGQASFPDLSDFQREKEPVAFLVRKGSDLSFLPFGRGDRHLNFSRFDVGGVYTTTQSDKLNAYLFSDRGIYRPGDEFHVAMIVKAPSWEQNLAGVPLETVITDPRGVEIFKRKFQLGAAGFEEVSYATEDTSPTGSYTVSVYVVKDDHRAGLVGDTTVRVEEFQPDRLRITSHLSKERVEGWVSPADLKGLVTLKNLFGTPATDRKLRASLLLSPGYPAFRSYRDYVFFDPIKTEKSFTENLEGTTTDDKGEAEFALGLEKFEKATYRLRFVVEGFEAEGGRAVTTESQVLVSPLDYLVGYKGDGGLGYLKKGAQRSVELIAVGPDMKKVAVGKLKAHLLDIRYVSVLTKQPDGTYRYQSVRKETTVSKKELSIPESGMKYELPTDQPGSFALLVRDENDTILNRIEFGVVGVANLTRNLEKNAELQITLSKSDYAPGEDIEMEIKAPYTGAGLITIEREKIYASKWFETTTTSSVQRIKVPQNLEGNGYVSVSFVRNIASKEIFTSPLSYGVVPFSVSRARRVNAIKLTIADLAKPGEPFKIRYQTAKPGKIVIWAVDEGILQVAKYQTPDPLAHFFKKKALEVSTSQILDLILPEFALVNKGSAAGGDGEGGALGKNLNPFKRKQDKPVAFWSGIVSTDGTPGQVVYHVPDYFNGTLSVFAAAVAPDSIGVERKKAFIRGPFVVTPNAPTFVAPGDEFIVSAGIANNVEGSGAMAKVRVELEVGEGLTLGENGTKELQIGEMREAPVKYKVKATKRLGSARLTFKVSMGDKSSRLSVELSVRPSVPYRTALQGGNMKKDSADVETPRRMYAEYRKNEVLASPLPLALSRGLMLYLENYPYGCTEQLVSKAFPALVLRSHPELGYSGKTIESNLRETMKILRARQNEDGGFGFWTAGSYVSDFQVAYATHFLMEAQEKGYPVARDMLAKALGYLQGLASAERDGLPALRTAAYSVYLLTRSGKVTTSLVAGIRQRLDASYKESWKTDLAGIYLAATYKLLQQDGEARKIISAAKPGDPTTPNYEYFYDGMVRDAQLIYILSRHFPDTMKALPGESLETLVQGITRGWYNTLSSSYTILALDAYSNAMGTFPPESIGVTEYLDNGKEHAIVIPQGLFPRIAFSESAKSLKIFNKNKFSLFYQVLQAGFDLALPDKPLTQNLEVSREYRDDKGAVVTSSGIGNQLEVHVKIRSVKQGGTHHVAVVDLLPGGFEPILESLRPAPPPGEESTPGGTASPEDAPREDYVPEGEGEGDYHPEPDARLEKKSRTVHAGLGGDLPDASGDPAAQPARAPDAAPDAQRAPAANTNTPVPNLPQFTAEYVDIREDRVVFYGHAAEGAQEFVYKIRATNAGTFVIPPVFGESMYDRTVQGMSLGGQMTVKGNE